MRLVLPFKSWNPDGGLLFNEGMVDVSGCIPYDRGLVPVSLVGSLATELPGAGTDRGRVLGQHTHLQEANTAGWKIYFGTGEEIYEFDPDSDTITEVSKTGGYSSLGQEGWSFTSFGQHVIAAGGHSVVPQIREAAAGGGLSSDFEDLFSSSTYEPKAKFCAALGSRVVLANCANTGAASSFDPDPNLVFVSTTDNARDYSDPSTSPGDRTDFYLLYDDLGAITGLRGGREYGLLFKERGVYRVEYQGAYGLEFVPVSHTVGTIYPQSLVWVDQALYFWADRGPARVIYDQVEDLAAGVASVLQEPATGVGEFIPQEVNAGVAVGMDRGDLVGAYDHASNCVVWTYRNSGGAPVALWLNVRTGTGTVCEYDRLFADTVSDDWRPATVPVGTQAARVAPRDLYFLYGSDSGPVLAIFTASFNTSGASGMSDAPIDEMVFRFPFTSLSEEGVSRVLGIRPLYTHKSSGNYEGKLTAKVYTRLTPWGDTPSDAEQEDSSDTDEDGQPDSRGFIRLSQSKWGELHSLEVRFDCPFTSSHPGWAIAELKGIEVEYEVRAGDSSKRVG